jgi:hypothetical protein
MKHAQRFLERAARLRGCSMPALLILLMLTVFVVPATVTPDSKIGQILQDVLLSLIVLSGALAVSDRRIEFVPLALVAIVVIAVRWEGWFFPPGLPPPIRSEALLFALALLIAFIGIKVFGAGTAMLDRIWGAIVLYMLVGVLWGLAYELVNIYIPAAYQGIAQGDKPDDRWTWVYFSFTTLTTVGYGDITPVARAARSLSNLEALIGQLYPAVVLARLVSLQVAGSGSTSNKS